jgi:histone H3/H4
MSEVLVVTSKIKKYIKAKADMNTSSSAIEALSKVVEDHIAKAIEEAKKAKRKTVMDRDFKSECHETVCCE